MAANISIYSNTNGTSKTVTFDFGADVVAGHSGFNSTNAAAYTFYIKTVSSARHVDGSAQGGTFPTKVIRDLGDLALNNNKQAIVNTAVDYADIRSMIVDYVYDYINGHSANKFGSGVAARGPMKFE